MDSIDYPPPSPFICPAQRTGHEESHRFERKIIGAATYLIIGNSYHISDQLSHSHHLRLLYGCNNKEGAEDDFFCTACRTGKFGATYYFCNKCKSSYHKECVESPPILTSPFHPKYPLQLLKLIPAGVFPRHGCHSCGIEIIEGLFYYSSISDLILDPVCARKLEFSAINNPKRHEHILHYFPRKISLTCDVCGSDDNKHCFYLCLQCGFVVHITCIYLPRVILISFHNHRLSFTSSLSSANWFCGICRRKIDENYGEYSCTKGCSYAVHSKCATRDNVWDGKELEDQPEMIDDDIKSFEEIGDGTIRHFSHSHHLMRLDEDTKRVYDEEQQCQACVLPLYDGNVYRCTQCEFALHEVCANLPRIKHNVLHPHRFILEPSDTKSSFLCFSCERKSCGFKYKCYKGCEDYDLDVRCASLSESVDHQSHPQHPLFLIYERGNYQACSACGNAHYQSLNCAECDFVLCFGCATLPYKVKHEDDEHMLSLSYEGSASDHPYWCQVYEGSESDHPYWCQVCEETTDPDKGYYACNECGVTFHIQCTLRIDNPYVKAGLTIEIFGMKIEIIPNNRLSRLICSLCDRHCQYKIAYKTRAGNIICSMSEIYFDPRYL